MNFNLKIEGEAELAKWFKLKPTQIARASRLTVNKTTTMLHKKLAGDIPRKHGTSIVGYRKVRAKKTLSKVKKRTKNVRGITWLGANDIDARYAGKMRTVQGGVRAGRHFFENAFIATMKSGYTGIFERIQGGSKIKKVMIPLTDAHDMAQVEADKALKYAQALLNANLYNEFNKSVKR